MKKLFIFPLFFGLSSPAFSSCKLPPGEQLIIGCSYNCGFLNKLRLRLASLSMGHSVEFVSLRGYATEEAGLSAVDGMFMPGGADIDPVYYLNSVTPELAEYTRQNLKLVKFTAEGKYRDAFEYKLVQTYSSDSRFKKLPLLGICRGMQVMSVAQGIPLYLDIKAELGIKNRRYLFDKIDVAAGPSLMTTFYGPKKVKGFEKHHQGIRMDYFREHQGEYPLVKVTATSNQGRIAEAIEYTHRKALGVQFHPERSAPITATPILRWFLNEACEYKTSRDDQQNRKDGPL